MSSITYQNTRECEIGKERKRGREKERKRESTKKTTRKYFENISEMLVFLEFNSTESYVHKVLNLSLHIMHI